jgi:hypothetical protein
MSRGHAVKGTVGAKRAGRPVAVRTEGFANDVAYLTRLRTALVMDQGVPRNEQAQIMEQIDRLIESLARLTNERTDQKSA